MLPNLALGVFTGGLDDLGARGGGLPYLGARGGRVTIVGYGRYGAVRYVSSSLSGKILLSLLPFLYSQTRTSPDPRDRS